MPWEFSMILKAWGILKMESTRTKSGGWGRMFTVSFKTHHRKDTEIGCWHCFPTQTVACRVEELGNSIHAAYYTIPVLLQLIVARWLKKSRWLNLRSKYTKKVNDNATYIELELTMTCGGRGKVKGLVLVWYAAFGDGVWDLEGPLVPFETYSLRIRSAREWYSWSRAPASFFQEASRSLLSQW